MKVMNLDAVATRRLVFAYDVAWFTGLGVLAFVYFKTGVRAWVPTELKPIPVYSAWFGALGSVAIGFHGVFEHGAVDRHGNSLWSGRWPLWYAGRPFSGMLTGVMTYVLLRVASGDAPDLYVTIAAAFIFGTQENLFFRFLSRIAKVIVSTDEPHAGDS